MSGMPGSYSATWFNPENGKIVAVDSAVAGGKNVSIEMPFENDGVLILERLQ
jgi:hypothetical protein